MSDVFWRNKTNKGRVVYDRPTNKFRCTDVFRILNKIGDADPGELRRNAQCYEFILERTMRILWTAVFVTVDEYDPILEYLWTFLQDQVVRVEQNTNRQMFEYGGGETGGGGASREF